MRRIHPGNVLTSCHKCIGACSDLVSKLTIDAANHYSMFQMEQKRRGEAQQRAEAAEQRAEKLAAEWGLLKIEMQVQLDEAHDRAARLANWLDETETKLIDTATERDALKAQLRALQRAHAHQRNLLADLYAWVQTHTNQVMPADLVDPVRAALASAPREQ